MKYPVAETFLSVQGEGLYAGTPMFFVRLAGCPVGVLPTEEALVESGAFLQTAGVGSSPMLPLWRSLYPEHRICEDAQGRKFLCDTNYQPREHLSVEDILDLVPTSVQAVCLTGGEPYAHKVQPLIAALLQAGHTVHVETSGTQQILPASWVACSPKRGFLLANSTKINEFKFLVAVQPGKTPLQQVKGIRFFLDLQNIPQPVIVWLQPINRVKDLDHENVALALAMLRHAPEWRLSLQLHKVLGVR